MNTYDIVTNRIIEQLEKGVVPWRKTWVGSCAINYVSRKAYRGVNTLLLPTGGEYLTFRQVQSEGGTVKKGEKANMVVFYKKLDKRDAAGEVIDTYPMLRYYNVFHISQCEGIQSRLDLSPSDAEPIDEAQHVFDDYVTRSGVSVTHAEGSGKAFYDPVLDDITLPVITQFESAGHYYCTAFHEAAHSTGHKSRQGRISDIVSVADGGDDYSQEELVAEITSTMVMNAIGISCEDTEQNAAAYIGAYLKKLRSDSRFIVKVSTAAQKAADLILNENTEAAA